MLLDILNKFSDDVRFNDASRNKQLLIGFNLINLIGSSLRYACRALFEKHKLLFSFHMCAEVMRKAAKINAEEYNFFLQGGIVSSF